MTRLNALFAPGIPTTFNADGWTLVAPFGAFPFTNGGQTFVQVFNADNAAEIVTAFNSLWSKLARVVGPVFGGHACPVWLGHPDFGSEVWKERRQLGTVEGLRVTERGLEAQLALNADGQAIRAEGVHIFPSVAVECEPEAGTNRIHPKLLWSVGLWKKPNIPTVDSLATINATPEDATTPPNQEQGTPNQEPAPMKLDPRLKKLLAALGLLPADAPDDMEESALEDLTTQGCTAIDAYKTKAATADESVTAANAARDTAAASLTTLNADLAAIRESRAKLAVENLLASGHIIEADRAATLTTLNAADFDAQYQGILDKGPKVSTASLKLGGAREKIASIQDARTAINAETAKLTAEGMPYNDSFEKAKQAHPQAWKLIEDTDKAKRAS